MNKLHKNGVCGWSSVQTPVPVNSCFMFYMSYGISAQRNYSSAAYFYRNKLLRHTPLGMFLSYISQTELSIEQQCLNYTHVNIPKFVWKLSKLFMSQYLEVYLEASFKHSPDGFCHITQC